MASDAVGFMRARWECSTYHDFLMRDDVGAEDVRMVAQFVNDHGIDPDAVIVDGDTVIVEAGEKRYAFAGGAYVGEERASSFIESLSPASSTRTPFPIHGLLSRPAESREARIQFLMMALEQHPEDAERMVPELNRLLELEAVGTSEIPDDNIQIVSGEDLGALAPIFRVQFALDAYFTLEAQGVDVWHRETAAREALDSLAEAEGVLERLQREGDDATAAEFERVLRTSWALLSQRGYAATSGRYEFSSLEPIDDPQGVSLETIADGHRYIPEGATSSELVLVAERLAEMDLNGARAIMPDGLIALGWSKGIGRDGSISYDPPSQVTLSSDNALGQGLRIFKQYLVAHGLDEGIDSERVELTPRTAAALLENRKHYAALSQVSDHEKKEMVVEAAVSPIVMLYQGARDTFSWIGDVVGTVNATAQLSGSAVGQIESLRDRYGATNPAPLQFARSLFDVGINATIENLLERYEASGRGRQMEAVVGGVAMAVPMASLAIAKLPAAASRLQGMSRLVGAGELTRCAAAMRLTKGLVAAGVRGVYEYQLGAVRDMIILTREGGVVLMKLTGQAAKSGWAATEAAIVRAIHRMKGGVHRFERWAARLSEILENVPRFRLGWKEIPLRSPAAGLATPDGMVVQGGERTIRVPHISAMVSDDGHLPARRPAGPAAPGPSSEVRRQVAENVMAAVRQEAANGRVERQSPNFRLAVPRGNRVSLYVDLDTGAVVAQSSARDAVRLEFTLDPGENSMRFPEGTAQQLRALARESSNPTRRQVLEGLADVAGRREIVDSRALGAESRLIGMERDVEIVPPADRAVVDGNVQALRRLGDGREQFGMTRALSGRAMFLGTPHLKMAVMFIDADGRFQGAHFAVPDSPRGTYYESGIAAGDRVRTYLYEGEIVFWEEMSALNPKQREVVAEMARASDGARKNFEARYPYAISSLRNEGMGPVAHDVVGAMLETIRNQQDGTFGLVREGHSYRVTRDPREFGDGIEVKIALISNPDHAGGHFVQFQPSAFDDAEVIQLLTNIGNSWNTMSSEGAMFFMFSRGLF